MKLCNLVTMEESHPVSPREIIKKINSQLQEEGIAPGLAIGERAPDFTLPNIRNQMVSLYERLNNGPVVLSFYRGAWCSHCNRELNDLQDHYQAITALGASILAIAPQIPEKTRVLEDKHNLQFELLSDVDMSVTKNYKLHFTKHEKIQDIYIQKFKLDLPKLTANQTWELPVPATYIIDSDGIVQGRFVEMDYTLRMSAVDCNQ
ncbi:MAG: peroxiredoxin-like family protein [Candidatus Kariarchaeaceae archaeon]